MKDPYKPVGGPPIHDGQRRFPRNASDGPTDDEGVTDPRKIGARMLAWMVAMALCVESLVQAILAVRIGDVFATSAWIGAIAALVVLGASIENIKRFLGEW
jgi:hypothetical protein